MRSEALHRGELPLRDFADAELRGAWPPLSYMVPAWAQYVWGHNLLAEAYLTAGAMALAYATLFLAAFRLSGRGWWSALSVVTLAIVFVPKLYNYPKVLTLAIGASTLLLVSRRPSTFRIALVSAATVVAALFRHDYGVYLATAFAAGMVALESGRWRSIMRTLGTFTLVTIALLLPSMVWVHTYEGMARYLGRALRTSALESQRTVLRWPELRWSIDEQSLIAFTYYAFWMLPLLALALLAWRWKSLPADERAAAAALVTLAIVTNVFFLRANLAARFGDAVGPVGLVAAWTIGAASRMPRRAVGVSLASIPLVLLGIMVPSAYAFDELAPDLQNTGLTTSFSRTVENFKKVRAALKDLPDAAIANEATGGTLRVAQYLSDCTKPDDRILVAAYAPEILVFARRGFAGGQPTVSLALYESEAEQNETLARWRRQSVPIVVTTDEFEQDFVENYPLLARHLAERYHQAGTIDAGDGVRFRVFIENGRGSPQTHPRFALPCPG